MIDREVQYRGAKFYRCALQVNPHSYLEQFRGQKHAQDEDEYIQEFVRKAKEIGVDMNIAVVDASTHLLHFSRMTNAKITSISSKFFLGLLKDS